MASGDVIMLLPGISGSTLSRDGRVIWGASLGGLFRAITSGGDTIRSLALTHGDDPDEDDIDGVEATSLIPDLHLVPGLWKIDGYTKVREQLVSRLGLTPGQNFFEFPYDWRRDNRVSARKLAAFAREKLRLWRERSGSDTAKLVFVTHSMGGLVARGFIDAHEGWRDTRALITLGTPHRGSLNALGYLANGFAKGIGPIKIDLSEVARTFTGIYQLLPAYPCIDTGNGALSRVKEVPGLPNIDDRRAAASAAFFEELEAQHDENAKLDEYLTQAPRWFPVIGGFQPTMLSARFVGGAVTLLRTLDGKDESGDGTVPRGSAMPTHLVRSSAGMYAEQVHGSLQNDKSVLDQVVAVIEGLEIDYAAYRAGMVKVGLDLEDAYAAGQPIMLRARTSERVATLNADIYDARVPAGRDAPRLKQVVLRNNGQGELAAETVLPEGAYRLTAGGAANVAPTTDCFLVLAEGG